MRIIAMMSRISIFFNLRYIEQKRWKKPKTKKMSVFFHKTAFGLQIMTVKIQKKWKNLIFPSFLYRLSRMKPSNLFIHLITSN